MRERRKGGRPTEGPAPPVTAPGAGAQVIQALGTRPGHRPGLLIYSATPKEELDRALLGTGLGYDAFLEKPATLLELKAALKAVLELSGTR